MDNRHHIAGADDFAQAFAVSRETAGRLEVYASLLAKWQKTINLVAPNTMGDVWHRHFADSAQLVGLAHRKPLAWLDLGSGGGFPGLVVGFLLAERPGSRLALIESDSRKCAFLREVVRQTGLGAILPVDIVTDRIENAANTARVGGVDVISARALAPLDRLLGWCQPYFGAGSMAVLPKGKGVDEELAGARRDWDFDAELVPSLTSDDGRIVVLRRLVRRRAHGKA